MTKKVEKDKSDNRPKKQNDKMWAIEKEKEQNYKWKREEETDKEEEEEEVGILTCLKVIQSRWFSVSS